MLIPKAFLSHSSKDKEFVRSVAHELGRQYCIFDEQVFSTGEEFKNSIIEGLDDSSIFVLFASKNSLLSSWVNFEIEESWYTKLEKNLLKHLVYLISDSVEYDDLPVWLKRAKIQKENSPKIVARNIRDHLEKLNDSRKNPFVGRNQDIQKLAEQLIPESTLPPNIFFVTGLPGIGRRSLLQRVVPEYLNLKPLKSPIRLGEGFHLQEICISIADFVEPYSTEQGFKRIMQEIKNLSDEEALNRTLKNLRRMTNQGELPVFLDEGGLFDSDGNILESVQLIIQSLSSNNDIYTAFISNRRPKNYFSYVAVIPLKHLTPEDSKLLIKTLDLTSVREHKRVNQLRQEEILELSDYTAGYPPSAYAAIEQVNNYGIEIVLTDKQKFTELRINQFLKHFANIELTEIEKNILCLLAHYSPLPLAAIASTLSGDMKNISSHVSRLIDISLVVVEERLYRIADPVSDAALKAFGIPSQQMVKTLAHRILDFIDDPKFEDRRLELHRILYRVSWLINDKKIQARVVYLFNDLIRTIKTLYDQERNYPKVVEVSEIARLQCKNKNDYETVLTYIVKSLIHQEKWEEASKTITLMKDNNYAPSRNIYYLQGFLNRKKRTIHDAITCYIDSKDCGRKDESLFRELGHCYFLIGEYETAQTYVQKVLKQQKDKKRINFYILDLQIQISMALGDKINAQESIEQLKELEETIYYYRRSRFEFLFGDENKAEEYVSQALNLCNGNPRFEFLSHACNCKISLRKIEDAQTILDEIDQSPRFGKIYGDIRTGLRAKLMIARQKFEQAVQLSGEIVDKSTKPYKTIRRDALKGYLENCVLRDSERNKLSEECRRLDIELSNIDKIKPSLELDEGLDLD